MVEGAAAGKCERGNEGARAGHLILLGALAIVVMLFAPKGIWGYLAEGYDLAVYPVRQRLVRAGPER